MAAIQTSPALLASHGVDTSAGATEAPTLRIFVGEQDGACNTLSGYCVNRAHITAELVDLDGKVVWSGWAMHIQNTSIEPVMRKLVAAMIHDQVIPETAVVPPRTFVVASSFGHDFQFRRFEMTPLGNPPYIHRHSGALLSTSTLDVDLGLGAASTAAAEEAIPNASSKQVAETPPELASAVRGCGESRDSAVMNGGLRSYLADLATRTNVSYAVMIAQDSAANGDTPESTFGVAILDVKDPKGVRKIVKLSLPYCVAVYDRVLDRSWWRPLQAVQDIKDVTFQDVPQSLSVDQVDVLSSLAAAAMKRSILNNLKPFIDGVTP